MFCDTHTICENESGAPLIHFMSNLYVNWNIYIYIYSIASCSHTVATIADATCSKACGNATNGGGYSAICNICDTIQNYNVQMMMAAPKLASRRAIDNETNTDSILMRN